MDKEIEFKPDTLNMACFLARGILQSNNENVWVENGWSDTIISFAQHVRALHVEGKYDELEKFIEFLDNRRVINEYGD
jgi:hypothetical protein